MSVDSQNGHTRSDPDQLRALIAQLAIAAQPGRHAAPIPWARLIGVCAVVSALVALAVGILVR